MQKVSLIGAIILSAILPGAGLLLVSKGGWFAAYVIIAIIGWLLTFLFGLGLLILIPLWPVAFIHTFIAVKSHNKIAMSL